VVLAGIRLYFEKALGTYLLYRFERLQYEQVMGSDKDGSRRSVCEVYGAEHLLRLFGTPAGSCCGAVYSALV
jgi:mortality factor 4-like protein 1